MFKSHPKLNRHSDERLVINLHQNTQGVRFSKSRTRVNKTGFSKIKRSSFTSPYLLFVIPLWKFLLTWAQTTYESTYMNF